MNKKFFADIKQIRNAIDTNKLVIFAGAGISVDAGIPGWNVLVDELKSEIEIPDSESDFLRIAQMYYNDRRQKEYIDKVRQILKHRKVKYNEIHEEIFRLNPEHILTTNYDDLLEQVIKKQSLPFSVVAMDKEFPYALNTNLLVKIHGDLDNNDIVLKEDDYLDYSLNHPLIESFLKSVFASKIILFVGYGFSDINLKMIIQTVRNILGKDFQNAYLLSVDKNLHPTQREYLKNKGVNVVNYYDSVNKNDNNYITDYLNGNNAIKKNYFRKGDNLTETGQHLLNFLRFISSYDKFNEPLTELNLIDQIYLSLNRFSEFKSLPPDFVANLFPFNISTNYVHNYERYSLITKNHKLYDLFFDQIEYVDDEVKFKPAPEMNLSDEQIKEFEDKLREIIRTLNLSLIFYLFKENDKPDSFGNFGWSDKYKQLLIKSNIKCNCLLCRLHRLEFSSVIAESFNINIEETTNIQSDLSLAYANYKIGNFYHSLKLFDEVANKSWQAGKYFSYYIAKHNVKTLRNLIYSYELSLKEEEREKILQELDDIDFDKLGFQIPFMGKKEYELLKAIRDDDILKKAENEINSLYENILERYEGYKLGTRWFAGPYYPQAVEIELQKIISFYTNNCIIIDEYSNFTKVCKKAVEALMISYATSKDYNEKLKEFNKLFFDVVVSYCNAKEVKALSEKLELSEITFNEKNLPDILESVNNFLKSFFTVTTFLGTNTLPDNNTRKQVSSMFFQERCRERFSNIFLLLSGIELTKDVAKDLIPNLLGFIENEDFLYSAQVNYLSGFINKNYKLFSQEDLSKILKLILHKLNSYYGNFLRAIAYAFKKNKFPGISDQQLLLQILSLGKENDRRDVSILHLWEISDEKIKSVLKGRIMEMLGNKFESILYTNAVDKGIIDFNQYFEKYIAHINDSKGNGQYTLHLGKPKMQSFEFINAMSFIYHQKVESSDERLKAFTNLADYMKFYLNPETFDYISFKSEWLFIIGDWDTFWERFAKIPELKLIIEQQLKSKFDIELAEIYSKYFIQ